MIGFRGAPVLRRALPGRLRAGVRRPAPGARGHRAHQCQADDPVLPHPSGEARRVLAELERNGLRRGVNGLEVYVMCEIPPEQRHPGRGVRRTVRRLLDRVQRPHPAVPWASTAIPSCWPRCSTNAIPAVQAPTSPWWSRRPTGPVRPVGISGQAPSDYPEFAEYLAALGSTACRFDPDALMGVGRLGSRRPPRSGPQRSPGQPLP